MRHRVWFVSCWEQPVGLQTPVLVVLLDLQHLVLRNSKVSGAAALLKNDEKNYSFMLHCMLQCAFPTDDIPERIGTRAKTGDAKDQHMQYI